MEVFSSASGSTRRARASSSGNQVAACLVDGCRSDLSKCRDYHRRHKVCEMHSKTPKVSIAGQEQRFCQQCSRFHSLGEFDEGKRSCRKRLEGHNRRRRKPQPESLPVKPGNFLSTGRGSMFLQFSNAPLIPASSVVGSNWSEPTKPKGGTAMYACQSPPDHHPPYSDHHHFRSRQFPFAQGSSSSSTPPHPSDFPNGWLNQGIDSALSLLSSSLAPTGTVHPHPARGTSHGAAFHHAGLDHLPNPCTSPSQGGYQGGSDGSCSNGHQQTVSFLWE